MILKRMIFSSGPIWVRFSSMRSIQCNDCNQYQSDFITINMRNIYDDSFKPGMDFEDQRFNKPLAAKRQSMDRSQKSQDKELYELCQQLTRENRHLKRELADLKKLLAGRDQESYQFCSGGTEQNYRELNYECYKKKAIHLLTSLKFLQNLYIEKISIDKRNKILDDFMGKGNCNHIDELLSLYGQCLNGRQEDSWNIDELERQSSQYQNNILRKHIKKLSSIMHESISSLKNNLNSLKVDIVANTEKIGHQIQYYCQKYMHNDREPLKSKQPTSNNPKKPKKKKSTNDENAIHKESWQKIVGQRSKLKEQKLQQNVKEKIHESLIIVQNQERSTMPLSNSNPLKPSIPKPQSKGKKQEITIIDELQKSKYLGSSATPSHEVSKSGYSQFRNSRKNSIKHYNQVPSNKKSQNASPKKTYSYYR